MGFWIFMVCMNLMIPLIMIVLGAIFLRHPPKGINGFYGYRTARSMASQEAWIFAQVYFGKLWLRSGIGMLLAAALAMLPCIGGSVSVVGTWGSILCLVECIGMLLPIIPTERALKRRF